MGLPHLSTAAALFFATCLSASALTVYDWHVFSSQEMGFRIEFPQEWSVTDDGAANKKFFRVTAPDLSSCGINKANEMHYSVDDLINGDVFERILLPKIKSAVVKEKSQTQWSLQPALVVVMTFPFESVGMSVELESLQVMTIKNGIAWVGVCSSQPGLFQAERSVFQAILSSVIIY
jgi:hypothetical protein